MGLSSSAMRVTVAITPTRGRRAAVVSKAGYVIGVLLWSKAATLKTVTRLLDIIKFGDEHIDELNRAVGIIRAQGQAKELKAVTELVTVPGEVIDKDSLCDIGGTRGLSDREDLGR